MKSSKAMSSPVKPLEFRAGLWSALMEDLRHRGNGLRESGAFLLGTVDKDGRVVREWLPYDDLDAAAQNFDYVRLSTNAFSKLWEACLMRQMEVVADVHTHPCGPAQSPSDRANPMISLPGHVALVVPHFALGDIRPVDVSVNVYLGKGRWKSYFRQGASTLIKLHE